MKHCGRCLWLDSENVEAPEAVDRVNAEDRAASDSVRHLRTPATPRSRAGAGSRRRDRTPALDLPPRWLLPRTRGVVSEPVRQTTATGPSTTPRRNRSSRWRTTWSYAEPSRSARTSVAATRRQTLRPSASDRATRPEPGDFSRAGKARAEADERRRRLDPARSFRRGRSQGCRS